MQVPIGKDQDNPDVLTKYLKVIDYVLNKFKSVIELNPEYLESNWEFIKCFWISQCSSKMIPIRTKMCAHVSEVSLLLLKEYMLSEKEIIGLFI